MMETTEMVIDSKLHLNSLIKSTLEVQKNGRRPRPSLIIMLVNQKKRKYEAKKIKSCNTSRIKSRNFLRNISYNGVKEFSENIKEQRTSIFSRSREKFLILKIGK